MAGGPQGCGAEGTTRILVHAPHSERFRAWRGGLRGAGQREPLGSWFMHRIPSGSVRGGGASGVRGRGNHSDPGSCTAFRAVPCVAGGPQGCGAEGTTRILVHAPHSERFRAWRGGLRGAGQREPLGSWFMHRIPSGSVRGGGASGVRGRGNHSDPGSCTAFRAVPCVAGGPQGCGAEGTTRILVHAPHSERFRPWRGVRDIGNHSAPGSCAAFRAVQSVAGGAGQRAPPSTCSNISIVVPPRLQSGFENVTSKPEESHCPVSGPRWRIHGDRFGATFAGPASIMGRP